MFLLSQVRAVSPGWWASLDYLVVLEPQGFLEGKDWLEGLEEPDFLAVLDSLDRKVR